MYQSKRFHYDYDDYEEAGKNAKTMLDEILSDPELDRLEEIVIGCWGSPWGEPGEGESVQVLIDGFVQNADRLQGIKSFFFGDMDYEDCEVSWINQGDYSKLWGAFPDLEKLTVKGSQGLSLGKIEHTKLKHLEIICGGLPEKVFQEITQAKLPALEILLLYIGVEEYGFDGTADTVKSLLEESDFTKLTYLGLTDSDIQDEVTEAVLNSKYASQVEVIDLSKGSLTDKGGRLLLEKLPALKNVKKLDVSYHYLSDEMMEKLKALSGIEVDVDEQNEADEYDGEIYYYPMLTE